MFNRFRGSIPGKRDAAKRWRAGDIPKRKVDRRKRNYATQAWQTAIVSSSGDAIVGMTLDGVITSWNRAAELIYGYTADEAIGRPIEFAVPDDRKREFRDNREKIMRGERVVRDETVLVTKGGRKIDVSITSSPIVDESGQIIGASTIARDITERKQAERALQKSQHILAMSQEMGHMGNWAWNVQTDEINLSDETFRILGHSPREVAPGAQWVRSHGHPGDRQMADDFFDAVRREGRRGGFDTRIIRPDGSVRYLNILADRIVRDKAGRVEWVYGIFQDVTDRKQAEETLRESEAKFRALADTSFGMIAVHRGSNWIYVNDAAETITGHSKDELLNMKFWDLFPADAQELIKERAFARLTGKSEPTNYETKLLTKAGKTKWVNLTAGSFIFEGKPAVIATMFDITASKNVEAVIKEEKAQAELFLDLMGHDISNMHQIALGYLELAREVLPEAGRDEFINPTIEVLQRSAGLIENVKKLQRSRMGECRPEVYDLGTLIEEVCGEFESVSGRYVNISCSIVKGIKVRANELLKDVFANLIGNAIKHSRRPVSINIRMNLEKNDGRPFCTVTVDDDGPGVPDTQKEKIFDRLYKDDSKMKGSGIGLHLVKALVESYGGKVWVEDRVKGDHTQGARFVVMLPAVEK